MKPLFLQAYTGVYIITYHLCQPFAILQVFYWAICQKKAMMVYHGNMYVEVSAKNNMHVYVLYRYKWKCTFPFCLFNYSNNYLKWCHE